MGNKSKKTGVDPPPLPLKSLNSLARGKPPKPPLPASFKKTLNLIISFHLSNYLLN